MTGLSELEQEVVNELRVYGFGGFMFSWIGESGEYSNLIKAIQSEQYPETERVSRFAKSMAHYMSQFDHNYLQLLPGKNCNPLKLEQSAWKLLTLKIKEYVDGFGAYLQNYTPESENAGELQGYLDKGDKLMQQWDVIGMSYFFKHDKHWDRVQEKEDAVRKLIVELDPIRGWYVQSFQALLDAADEMGEKAPYLDREFIQKEIERAKLAISYGESPIPSDPYDFVCGGTSSLRIVPQYSRDFVRIIAAYSIKEQDEFWKKVSSKLNFPHMINDDGKKYVIEKDVPEGKV